MRGQEVEGIGNLNDLCYLLCQGISYDLCWSNSLGYRQRTRSFSRRTYSLITNLSQSPTLSLWVLLYFMPVVAFLSINPRPDAPPRWYLAPRVCRPKTWGKKMTVKNAACYFLYVACDRQKEAGRTRLVVVVHVSLTVQSSCIPRQRRVPERIR